MNSNWARWPMQHCSKLQQGTANMKTLISNVNAKGAGAANPLVETATGEGPH